MGDRTHMVAAALDRSLRGAVGLALVVWTGSFDKGLLSPGSRMSLGRRAESNRRESRVERREPAAKRMVRRIGSFGHSGFRSQVSGFSHPGVHAHSAKSSRMDPLVSAGSRQTPQSPRLQVGPPSQASQPILSSSLRLCASARESAIPITHHLTPIT